MYKLKVPELGDDIKDAVVVSWNKQIGDYVSEDEDILELVTDKATFCISSEKSGILKEILVNTGYTVKIGQELAIIEQERKHECSKCSK